MLKIKNQSGFGYVAILLVIAIVIVSFAGWRYVNNKSSQAPSPSLEFSVETEGWSTVSDQVAGIQFEYPTYDLGKPEVTSASGNLGGKSITIRWQQANDLMLDINFSSTDFRNKLEGLDEKGHEYVVTESIKKGGILGYLSSAPEEGSNEVYRDDIGYATLISSGKSRPADAIDGEPVKDSSTEAMNLTVLHTIPEHHVEVAVVYLEIWNVEDECATNKFTVGQSRCIHKEDLDRILRIIRSVSAL